MSCSHSSSARAPGKEVIGMAHSEVFSAPFLVGTRPARLEQNRLECAHKVPYPTLP